MALVNLPRVSEAKSLKEVVNSVENMRKELEFLFQNIEIDNLNSNYVTVIESGSNANGKYRKMSDGTMECWHIESSQINTESGWYSTPIAGNTYYYLLQSWTFPVSFKVGSIVAVMASGDIAGAAPETHTAWHTDHVSARTESGIYGLNVLSSTGEINRSWYARGVWK